MMCSKDFERDVQCMDRRGVERNAPSQQESTITRKKMIAAHVALIAAILMAPTHEALARGAVGSEAATAGVLAEVSTVALVWDAASAPMICAPAVIAN